MQNPGPNTRVCLSCGNHVMDGMAKIITPPLSKASDNSQRAACPQCGGELSWNLYHKNAPRNVEHKERKQHMTKEHLKNCNCIVKQLQEQVEVLASQRDEAREMFRETYRQLTHTRNLNTVLMNQCGAGMPVPQKQSPCTLTMTVIPLRPSKEPV